MKYMVLECHPGYAVVLDEEGNFSKVANHRYEVGQMLTEVEPMQMPPKKRQHLWRYALAAVAACLVLVLGLHLPGAMQPYASVYVKINPEVRIDVNRQDRVVAITGINQDGIDLIQGYDYNEKQLSQVTDELVDLAIQMGYLKTDGEITISLDSKDQIWVENHSQAMSHHLQTHLQEEMVVTVRVRAHHHGEEIEIWDEEDEDDDGIYLDPQNPNRIIIIPDWDDYEEDGHRQGHHWDD